MALTRLGKGSAKAGAETSGDSAWLSVGSCDGDRVVRIAVCDGATGSMLAGRWSKILARELADSPRAARSARDFVRAVERAKLNGFADMDRFVEDRELSGRPLHEFEMKNMNAGAHSTAVVSEVRHRGNHVEFAATAVGDSVLFVLTGGRLELAFPIDDPALFGPSPVLVSSLGEPMAHGRVDAIRRTFDPDVVFIWASDAIAAWALRQSQSGKSSRDQAAVRASIWTRLQALVDGSQEEFEDWLVGERRSGRIADDDVTLVVLRAGDMQHLPEGSVCVATPITRLKPPVGPELPPPRPEPTERAGTPGGGSNPKRPTHPRVPPAGRGRTASTSKALVSGVSAGFVAGVLAVTAGWTMPGVAAGADGQQEGSGSSLASEDLRIEGLYRAGREIGRSSYAGDPDACAQGDKLPKALDPDLSEVWTLGCTAGAELENPAGSTDGHEATSTEAGDGGSGRS